MDLRFLFGFFYWWHRKMILKSGNRPCFLWNRTEFVSFICHNYITTTLIKQVLYTVHYSCAIPWEINLVFPKGVILRLTITFLSSNWCDRFPLINYFGFRSCFAFLSLTWVETTIFFYFFWKSILDAHN